MVSYRRRIERMSPEVLGGWQIDFSEDPVLYYSEEEIFYYIQKEDPKISAIAIFVQYCRTSFTMDRFDESYHSSSLVYNRPVQTRFPHFWCTKFTIHGVDSTQPSEYKSLVAKCCKIRKI